MKLTLLHGAPAVGKFTVGQALSALTGVPFVDNHSTIDLAKKVFDFGAPGFWETNHPRGNCRANCTAFPYANSLACRKQCRQLGPCHWVCDGFIPAKGVAEPEYTVLNFHQMRDLFA